MQPKVAWQPNDEYRSRSRLAAFLRECGAADFEEGYQQSINDPAGFTGRLLRFLKIKFQRPYNKVLDLSDGRAWPKWCTGGMLNISVSCLYGHPSERLAVVWEGEEGLTRRVTYGELRDSVERCAAGLRKLGVRKGDAVAIHLPMMPETVIFLLACAYMGAIAVPLFSGYGPGAIESRVRDVEAKVLVTFDSFPRRGVPVNSQADQADCPSVRHRVTVRRSGAMTPDLLSSGTADYEPTSAEDPLIVLYTSGTTGKPKGILHSHCGFPIKAAQDMCFGTDVRESTRICWLTDIGWMMGPWLIYGTAILGGTAVLYDGAPDFPDAGRLWRFAEAHKVEVLGLSPTLVRALEVHGDAPLQGVDLSSLRILASTGEPWNPDPWWWLFDKVGQGRIPIINYSGGTEISGGILMGNPLLPSKPCSFPAPCPGIAADIVGESGEPVEAGAVGELAIRQPWIGMARGFWKDPERYIETYWSRWPRLWAHGDWATKDEDGHWYILGRSDDTLKIAGKRVGPAEVESVLVDHPDVVEAAIIGVPHPVKGEAMVAFCVLAPSRIPSPALASGLRDLVSAELGKPLRPECVHFVSALPKTRNSKVMRRVIRAAYLDMDAGDLSPLENPSTVDAIRKARKSQP